MTIVSAVMTAVERHCLWERAALVYVTLPALIFTIGWIRPLFAVPGVAIVLLSSVLAMRAGAARQEPSAGPEPSALWQLLTYAILFAVVVLVVAYSGIGGYGFQYSSYVRSNSFLRDLIEYPWPLAYRGMGGQDEPGMLAYYIANSLTPAVIGKLWGWNAANHCSFVWGVLGVFLAVCGFIRVVGRISPLYGLLFLLVGGLDIIGWTVLLGWYSDGSQPEMLSQWMFYYASSPAGRAVLNDIFWLFPSQLSVLYYAPHHVFGCWLCLLLILDDAVHRRTCRRAALLWSCSLLWSAFSFVGILPFVLVAIWTARGRGLFSFPNVLGGPLILAFVGLFISSNNHAYPHGWLWEFQDVLRSWPTLALYYIVSFGLYALVRPRVERGDPRALHPIWWWTAIGCLLVLPWYHLGWYNDFSIKAGLPSIVVVLIFLAASISNARTETQRMGARVLVALMVVGMFSAVSDLTRGFRHGLDFAPPALARVQHVDQFGALAIQLFSDGDDFFWRVLAKRVPPQ